MSLIPLSFQNGPQYMYFRSDDLSGYPPAHFTMDPTRVVRYYDPNPFGNPRVQSALLSGGGAALGSALGGPAGAMIGGAAGPLVYSLITPEKEPFGQVALQSGLAGLGGGLGGAAYGPVGAGVGAGLGGFLGYKLI